MNSCLRSSSAEHLSSGFLKEEIRLSETNDLNKLKQMYKVFRLFHIRSDTVKPAASEPG